MSDAAIAVSATSAPAGKKKAAAKPKSAKTAPSHPKTEVMVITAIKALRDRKGSSLQAIKKHIAANNQVDMVKLSSHIRKCLIKGTESKKFEQTKGHGASGRFKLAEKAAAAPKPKKIVAKKAKKPAAEKVVKPKKAAPKKVKTPKKVTPKKAPKAAKPKVEKVKSVKVKKAAKPKTATKTKKPAVKKAKKPATPKKA